MNLFGNSDDNEDTADEIVEEAIEEAEDTPSPPTVTLHKAETASYKYTEHEAVAGFSDGGEREFTFDALEETSTAYVLKNYTQFETGPYGSMGPVKVRKVATLVKRNLNFLETTNRIQREKSMTTSKVFEDVPLPKAMYEVENQPDAYSFDESEVSDEALELWEPMKNF